MAWILYGDPTLTLRNAIPTDMGVTHASSMRYAYPLELHSREIITWEVVLWDEDDKEGKASETASFEIGLLNKNDWSAKWIRGDYKVNKKNRYPVDYFQKEVEVKDVKKARLYISALGLYEAYINGEKVGNAVLAFFTSLTSTSFWK